jgi:hypothetical protein
MDRVFSTHSQLGHKGEHMFTAEPGGLPVYTCVCNGWRVFVWKAAALVWNCEAYVFSPNTSLIEQFHRYPDVHDAKEAGVPVMRVSEPVDEITMCALIYDLCAAPNARGLSSYPAEFLTP